MSNDIGGSIGNLILGDISVGGSTDGPLKSLYGNSFLKQSFRFPADLGTSSDHQHQILFHINVQNKSSYLTNNQVIATGSPGTADINRAAAGNQLGSSKGSQNGGTGALGASGQFVGTMVGAVAGGQFGAEVGSLAGPEGTVIGAAAGAVVGGLVGEALASALDVTRKTTRLATTIGIYMPDNIQVKYAHNFDAISMTEALGKFGAMAQMGASVAEGVKGLLNSTSAKDVSKSMGSMAGPAAEVIGGGMEATGLVGEGFKDVALFSAGLAQNPQFEIVYKQTPNRDFQFDFKFVPKNAEEAQQILGILQTFRFHAAPEIEKSSGTIGRYLIPPSEFDIQFLYKGQENTNIPKISTCVLENIDINYTSSGTWTTFDDGLPVEIYMQLNFKEVEMITKDLIEKGY
jgi:hypothetical protein